MWNERDVFMEIRLLSADEAVCHRSSIRVLMQYCMEAAFPESIPMGFYDEKLDSLDGYLRRNEGYLFAALECGQMLGFLWACQVSSLWGPKFHVLYLAVLPDYRNRGLGKGLLRAAEDQARALGISRMELIASDSNMSALRFYHGLQYNVARSILEKRLDEEE